MKVTTQVARTAQDALNAKQSAVHNNHSIVPNDGSNSNAQSNRDLYKDLLDKIKTGKIRRQTPLVNAGYATRVLALSSTIMRFLQHLDDSHKKVNLVIIGAGLDVLGIWSTLVAARDYGENRNIMLYEIDCEQNYHEKIEALERSNLMTTSKTSVNGEIYEGKLSNSGDSILENNYILVKSDLRKVDELIITMKRTSFDNTIPTLVLSELVLAYLNLDQEGKYTDDLLAYIANDLCCSKSSAFLAYEPVAPDNVDNQIVGVARGYSDEYFAQFVTKLDKGTILDEKSRQAKKDDVSSSSFAPLGTSSTEVIQRMRYVGFDGILSSTSVSKTTRYFLEKEITSLPELFDEYAALRLHLQCYSIICAAGKDFDDPFDLNVDFWCKIFPWMRIENITSGSFLNSQVSLSTKQPSAKYIIRAIREYDQEEVRSLFKSSYEKLSTQYSSVRKLVKSALKNDLSTKPTSESKYIDANIWNKYASAGGGFWVATSVGAENGKILGCVGVKKVSSAIEGEKQDDNAAYYEINRLAVDPSVMRLGFGRGMLDFIEKNLKGRNSSVPIKLIASTPKVSQPANEFYFSNGFQVAKEVKMGTMIIRTFVKVIN